MGMAACSWIDSGWCESRAMLQSARQDAWLGTVARAVVIELGAGMDIPSVRIFSEDIVEQQGGRLVRIHPQEPQGEHPRRARRKPCSTRGLGIYVRTCQRPADFSESDLAAYCARWENQKGKSMDSRLQCFLSPYKDWFAKHGNFIPTLERPAGLGRLYAVFSGNGRPAR